MSLKPFVQVHALRVGIHFPMEINGEEIAARIRKFMGKQDKTR